MAGPIFAMDLSYLINAELQSENGGLGADYLYGPVRTGVSYLQLFVS